LQDELTKAVEIGLMSEIGDISKLSRQVENKIRHAEQGYSNISADVQFEEEELNRMYEWDLSLLQTIEFVGKMAGELNNSIIGSDGTAGQKMKEIRKALNDFNLLFERGYLKLQDWR